MWYLQKRRDQENAESVFGATSHSTTVNAAKKSKVYPCETGLAVANALCRYVAFKFTISFDVVKQLGKNCVDLVKLLVDQCDFAVDVIFMEQACTLLGILACDDELNSYLWAANAQGMLNRALRFYVVSSATASRAVASAVRYLTTKPRRENETRSIPNIWNGLVMCLRNHGSNDRLLAEHATASLANLEAIDLPDIVKLNHTGFVETLASLMALRGEAYSGNLLPFCYYPLI